VRRGNDITVKNKLTWERIIDSMYLLVLLICPIIVIAGACISETVGRSMLFIYLGVLYGVEIILFAMLAQSTWKILQNPKKFMTEVKGLYVDIMAWFDTIPEKKTKRRRNNEKREL
jgi:hypothetical protein